MILLRLISWQYVRKHVVRSLLTAAGIVLGIAVFVGMHTANRSVLYAFRQTIDRIAGRTQLQITAGESSFDESVLERVQALPEVAAASPVVESSVSSGIAGQGNLLVLGVDMLGDRSLRDYDLDTGDSAEIDDPLVFLAQPDSLILSQAFAARNGIQVGAKLSLDTVDGPKAFAVRGLMKTGGLASAFGGSLAVMDVYAAQKMFGRGRKFDRIDIGVREGVQVETVREKLQAIVGSGLNVEQPSARGGQFEATMQIYAGASNITSMLALFIGMFIIYNTFSIAVTQRRTEIGILRALGATRGQIRTLFLAESAIAGFVGSIAGVVLGLVIARGIAGYISGFLGEMYGVAERASEIAADPRLLGLALFLGVAISMVAAWIPARSAASVDPVKALQKGGVQTIGGGENRLRRILALLLACAAGGTVFLKGQSATFYSGLLFAIAAALLLAPTVTVWIARLLRAPLQWLRPVEGSLAADSLIGAPRRTSGTVSALMLSLGLVISLGGMAKASYASIRQWVDVALNPDLFVSPSEKLTTRTFRFPAEVGEELRAIEGVRIVQPVRYFRVNIGSKPAMLVAADLASLRSTTHLPAVEGSLDEMFARAIRGEGVIASDNFALLQKKHLGDVLEIPSPQGPLRLPIVGVITDFSDQLGSIFLNRDQFISRWNDTTVDTYRIYVTPGTPVAAVRERILQKLGSMHRMFVFTNRELRDYILQLTDQWFALSYIQIAVAVLVAMLGIVNALTVSIADRRRELGVLQAVGGLRWQIRHTIWMEAMAIGLIGLAMGLMMGGVQLYYSLEVTRQDLSGVRLAYEYPVEIALGLIPVMLATALLAAIGPAESAVRGSLVEALEYE